MFSSALKSLSSNISSNYTISPQPTSTSGPWKIFDAKNKRTQKAASVFSFDRKSLDPAGHGLGGVGRGGTAALKRAHEEVIERLKKEASSLARLRHPSILELAEPVEETRSGGLMFATEAVTASLAGLLSEKDDQERTGGVGGRGSRYVTTEEDGTHKRRELEIDELEIQKGLLQIGKGLEFMHESAGLVHANLSPEAIMINSKGDWKISGLAFCGPHEESKATSSISAISLHEVLNHDPRLPRNVQLNLDCTSPDFVLDNHLVSSADMFSLGLLVVALYNSPHTSPLSTSGSLSAYKRLFASSSSMPTQSNNFLVPSSVKMPPTLMSDLLPRLITRRPAQRLTAREFQQASYFDNILVSTIRFLDALPAKTPNEKAAFMRGLPRIMPQFPRSVLEKKVLPALLDEMKDKDLLAPILTNVFAMVKAMPTGKRAFTERVIPRLREIFLSGPKGERDAAKDAGLIVLLEHMRTVAENSGGKEFRDDILPIILLTLESPTHGLEDAALGTLPHVLPVLDFSTIKNELFPAIAAVFARTSSLNIKIKGLEAFHVLAGGAASTKGTSDQNEDDLNGIGVPDRKGGRAAGSTVLDKYTVQEKVVPLLKGIKTKEPGVMMAALKVFRQVGEVADSDFLAMDVLPILWSFSLGPLLNLQQFQAYMTLIKNLGSKIEREQTRKLKELGSGHSPSASRTGGLDARGGGVADANGLTNAEETDFESLVSGRRQANGTPDMIGDWGAAVAAPARPSNVRTQSQQHAATFSWQTPVPASALRTQPLANELNTLRPQANSPATRPITPDQSLGSFAALTPASAFSQPLQPNRPTTTSATSTSNNWVPVRPSTQTQPSLSTTGSTIDWSSAASDSASAWANQRSTRASVANGFGGTVKPSGFSIAPPPMSPPALNPPVNNQGGFGGFKPPPPAGTGGGRTGGLDMYESLL